MKKKFLLAIIFFTAVSFVGCNVDSKTFQNTTKREAYEKTEIEKRLKEFENKIGLENLSEFSGERILESPKMSRDEFIAMRNEKINKGLITKNTIYQVIERAKYLATSIYNDLKTQGTTAPAYTYMDNINDSDRLGNFLSKDLALEWIVNLF